MSNPRPTHGYEVHLDKKRHLKFTLAAIRRFQEAGDPSLGAILYQGLVHEDPELTLEQVEEMITLDMLEDIREPLREATGGAMDLDDLLGVADASPEKKAPEPETTSGS